MTDLPRELLRARTARLASSIGRVLTSGRQRATAVELLAQEKRLGGGAVVTLLESRLAQARAAEDEALDELGVALGRRPARHGGVSPPRYTGGVRDQRLAYHDSLDARGPVTYCATQGCGQPTRGAKPYCSEHVLAHPYAARVSRAWDARLAAAKGGDLSPELIADARQAVQELGTITTVRLARVLDVDAETVERVSQLLMRDGARPGRTRRGATTLTAPTRWGRTGRATSAAASSGGSQGSGCT